MFIVRDIVRCKPGRSRQLIEKFKSAVQLMERAGELKNGRILVDMVADYWTVVLEAEVESLAEFEQQMGAYSKLEDVAKAMEGYMELIEGGRREIFRVA
jgi:hypothetical protein